MFGGTVGGQSTVSSPLDTIKHKQQPPSRCFKKIATITGAIGLPTAFSPDGATVYYQYLSGSNIVLVSDAFPAVGSPTTIDTIPQPVAFFDSSVAADSAGNLYLTVQVTGGSGTLYKYTTPGMTRTTLTTFTDGATIPPNFTYNPVDEKLWGVLADGVGGAVIVSINTSTGSSTTEYTATGFSLAEGWVGTITSDGALWGATGSPSAPWRFLSTLAVGTPGEVGDSPVWQEGTDAWFVTAFGGATFVYAPDLTRSGSPCSAERTDLYVSNEMSSVIGRRTFTPEVIVAFGRSGGNSLVWQHT